MWCVCGGCVRIQWLCRVESASFYVPYPHSLWFYSDIPLSLGVVVLQLDVAVKRGFRLGGVKSEPGMSKATTLTLWLDILHKNILIISTLQI